jgi:hypothetical protein
MTGHGATGSFTLQAAPSAGLQAAPATGPVH